MIKSIPPDLEPNPDVTIDFIMDEDKTAELVSDGPIEEERLGPLISSYEGLVAACGVVASWLAKLRRFNNVSCGNSDCSTTAYEFGGDETGKEIEGALAEEAEENMTQALCLLLERRFDPDKLRGFMEAPCDGGDSWRPPPFYWQLMRTPLTAKTLKNLCRKDRRSEFLLAFNQDLLAIESRTRRNWKISMDTELGRITSNFTIFSKALAEVIHDFLLEDERADLGTADPNHFSRLLCHTENSYLYSQAILHFLPRWRPDLLGCRRLSQAIYRYVREVRGDHHVADVGLRFSGLGAFPSLHKAFITLQRQDPKAPLLLDDVCYLSDAVTKVLESFHRYQSLLYSRPRQQHGSTPLSSRMDEEDSSYFLYSLHKTNSIPGGSGKRRANLSVPQHHFETKIQQPTGVYYDSEGLQHSVESLSETESVSDDISGISDSTTTTIAEPLSFVRGQKDEQHSSSFIGLDALPALGEDRISLQDQLDSARIGNQASMGHNTTHSTHSSDIDKNHYINNSSVVSTVIQPIHLPPRQLHQQSHAIEEGDQHIDDILLAPASQAGDLWPEEYDRLRLAPEAAPLRAIREGILINSLLRDFVSSNIVLSAIVLPKLIELLLALTTLSPYEILVNEDELLQLPEHFLSRGSLSGEQSYHRQLPGHWTTRGGYNEGERSFDTNEDEEDDDDDEEEEDITHDFQNHVLEDLFDEHDPIPEHDHDIESSDIAQTPLNTNYFQQPTPGCGKIAGSYETQQQECSAVITSLYKTEQNNNNHMYYSTFSPYDSSDIISQTSCVPESCLTTGREDDSCQSSTIGSWTNTEWQQREKICLPSEPLQIGSGKGIWTNRPYEHHMCPPITPLPLTNESSYSYYHCDHSLNIQHSSVISDSTPEENHLMSTNYYSDQEIVQNCALVTTPPDELWLSYKEPESHSLLSDPIIHTTQQPFKDMKTVTEDHVTCLNANSLKLNELSDNQSKNQWIYSKSMIRGVPNHSKLSVCKNELFPTHTYHTIQSESFNNGTYFIQNRQKKRDYLIDGQSDNHSDITSSSFQSKRNRLANGNTNIQPPLQSPPAIHYETKDIHNKHIIQATPSLLSSSDIQTDNNSTIIDKLEYMKSTIGSDIYNDPKGQRCVGLPTNYVERRKAIRTRKQFRLLNKQIESYKERGRRDLFEIYSIVRDPLFTSNQSRLPQLLRYTTTLIGASAALSFIEHRIMCIDDDEADPLLTLSATILTCLIVICQRHPKKRTEVLSLFHRCFQRSHTFFHQPLETHFLHLDECSLTIGTNKQTQSNTIGMTGDSKLQQCKRQVFAFLMWLLGSGMYSGVFSFLQLHMSHVDCSLLRRHLELILEYCRPPYSPAFISALLRLLQELIFIQKPLNLGDSINRPLRNLIHSVLGHSLRGWAPRQPPSHIASEVAEIQNGLIDNFPELNCPHSIA